MKKALGLTASLALSLLVAACYVPKKEKDLDETLLQYEQMIRWSEWDGAANMLNMEYQLENPISNLEMERLRLYRVTAYTIRSAAPYDDGNSFRQVVEIRMYNKTRATEKVVMDSQLWKFDQDTERWTLHSGLPDVSKRY